MTGDQRAVVVRVRAHSPLLVAVGDRVCRAAAVVVGGVRHLVRVGVGGYRVAGVGGVGGLVRAPAVAVGVRTGDADGIHVDDVEEAAVGHGGGGVAGVADGVRLRAPVRGGGGAGCGVLTVHLSGRAGDEV